MSVWTSTPTQKGLALQSKLLSTDKLEITRVVSGAGSVPVGQLSVQTAVSDIKQNLTVESLTYDENGKGLLRVMINNYSLQTGYSMNQIGIYANDPDEGEILYVIAQVTDVAEKIPSITEQPAGFTCGWAFRLTFSNSSNISITITPDAFITSETADLRYASKSHAHDLQYASKSHRHDASDILNLPEAKEEFFIVEGEFDFEKDIINYVKITTPLNEIRGAVASGKQPVLHIKRSEDNDNDFLSLPMTEIDDDCVAFDGEIRVYMTEDSTMYFPRDNVTMTQIIESSESESGFRKVSSTILSTASGVEDEFATVAGWENVAYKNQFVLGKYADTTGSTDKGGVKWNSDTTGSLFTIGNGTDEDARTNVFRASASGRCYGSQAFGSSGADYAEYFEWLDGNPDNEDRRGKFVTLDGEYIRVATSEDDYILGVISATPSIVGDVHSEAWKDMYKRDVFGERITETVTVPETVDKKTKKTIPEHTETRWILNPEYDSSKGYLSRDERQEWAAVGLMGKLIVTDDGSCQVNGYCSVSSNGTATASDSGYRVMKRIDDTHIKILFR